MTDREYVESVWERVQESEYDPHEGYTIPQTKVEFGPYYRLERYPTEAYASAAAFTREREKEIRQVDEEIAMLRKQAFSSGLVVADVTQRILKRLQSIRSDLTRGMKQAQKGER